MGARDLAQGLVTNVSLRTLNLAWNGLEDPGCTAIAQAMHQNMGITVGFLLDAGHAGVCVCVSIWQQACALLDLRQIQSIRQAQDALPPLLLSLHACPAQAFARRVAAALQIGLSRLVRSWYTSFPSSHRHWA